MSSTLFKYDYDLPLLLVLYLSSLIFGCISDVISVSDLFTQFVFESLKNWVGMTILLFFVVIKSRLYFNIHLTNMCLLRYSNMIMICLCF